MSVAVQYPFMSSLRQRSSRSTLNSSSTNLPTWRSNPKLTAPVAAQASLSFVVAEPELGASLESAVTKLPVQRRSSGVGVGGSSSSSRGLRDVDDGLKDGRNAEMSGGRFGRAVSDSHALVPPRKASLSPSSSSSPPTLALSSSSPKRMTRAIHPSGTGTGTGRRGSSSSTSSSLWFATLKKSAAKNSKGKQADRGCDLHPPSPLATSSPVDLHERVDVCRFQQSVASTSTSLQDLHCQSSTAIPTPIDIPPSESTSSTVSAPSECHPSNRVISNLSGSTTPPANPSIQPGTSCDTAPSIQLHPESDNLTPSSTPVDGSLQVEIPSNANTMPSPVASPAEESSAVPQNPSHSRFLLGFPLFGWSSTSSSPAAATATGDSPATGESQSHDSLDTDSRNRQEPSSSRQDNEAQLASSSTAGLVTKDNSSPTFNHETITTSITTPTDPTNDATPTPVNMRDSPSQADHVNMLGTDKPAGTENNSNIATSVAPEVEHPSAVPGSEETEKASSSWWDYIGWKSTATTNSAAVTTAVVDSSVVDVGVGSDEAKNIGLEKDKNTNMDKCTEINADKVDTKSTTSDGRNVTIPTTKDSSTAQARNTRAVPTGKAVNEGSDGVGNVNGHATTTTSLDPIGSSLSTSASKESARGLSPVLASRSGSVPQVAVGGKEGLVDHEREQDVIGFQSAGSGEVGQKPEEAQGRDRDHVSGSEYVGGAWYSPWAWYGHAYGDSTTATAVTRDPIGTEEGKDDQSGSMAEKNEMEGIVEAADERVEVEAGRTMEEVQIHGVSSLEPSTTPSVAGVEINPIAATIESHRYGWASFFTSRASRTLVVKSITGPVTDSATSSAIEGVSGDSVKVDENGMEVMDIEDGDAAKEAKLAPAPDDTKSRGLVATLVRGRGKVRTGQRTEQDTTKDGDSDTSSIRSGAGGRKSGSATPVGETNGAVTPTKQNGGSKSEETAIAATSVSSSPQSTTSFVKKASLSLAVSTRNSNAAPSNSKKPASPAPLSTSKKFVAPPAPPPPPNLVLPSWQDTFHTAPRDVVPRPESGKLAKTVQYFSGMLFSGGRTGRSASGSGSGAGGAGDKGKRRASSLDREREFVHFGKPLPRAWDVMEDSYGAKDRGSGIKLDKDVLRGCTRVVVIGVHGWFPGAVMRTVLGEPTGTSSKFANMMVQALEDFQAEHGVQLEKITRIPLEGEGTIKRRVEKLYSNLLANQEWMDDIHAADAILVATHSQGSIVSTHLLDCLIRDKHIRTSRNSIVAGPAGLFPASAGMETAPAPRPQRVCCLALCGIHLGPLRYLSTSSLFQPYFQYIESPAARELFEFQNTESEVSKEYAQALGNVLDNGTKMLYVASLNDQVVPIYSGLFTAASHPLILRALYIDGDAYHSSDFLANLLVLLLRILNSGISESGLLVHLSEATAGSLSGVGHSTVYEEVATYALAVKYLFLTNDGLEEHPELVLEPFNARLEQNDYEIPWSLRDIIADERVIHFFSQEIVQLRDAFREWHPRTSILRDLKRKLQPIQRLPASFPSTSSSSGTLSRL
ncbi:hypothetical protein AX17_007457 [Amanita inopinata Kibby_2008]|nr:hypothetical protein AX17_007457 [Amanita inopinata Kibby_2008]